LDLSNGIFMTTANGLDTIQTALRDRMEIIFLSGYTEEEKLEIAKRHLVPKQVEENGLKTNDVKFDRRALAKIISEYTQEAGLRHLEREIGKVCRKVARKKAEQEKDFKPVRVTPDNVREFLRVPRVFNEGALKKDQIGTVTGLAWTAVGGDILFIEALKTKGKGKLQLTGQLGEVMQESAQAAYSYAKARATEIGIDEQVFENFDIHIHMPEGANPKDGPSAGVTMMSAIASALTGKRVKPFLAMTGEITLRGQVLPVGGIKEKVLAAKRAGLKEIILCWQNEKDVQEIESEFIKGIKFHYVKTMSQVLELALVP